MTLRVENLSCHRGERSLFQNLSFEIKAGELCQITGRNGSGKTSLLRILTGLSDPTEGVVTWKQKNILQYQSYQHHICYLAHQTAIKLELTPLENLRVLTVGHLFTEKTLEDALNKVGLGLFIDQACNSLSAGQLKRIQLARLILLKDKLWILDEPFTSLDKQAQELLISLLKEHLRRDGSVVLTSHQDLDLQEINYKQVDLDS